MKPTQNEGSSNPSPARLLPFYPALCEGLGPPCWGGSWSQRKTREAFHPDLVLTKMLMQQIWDMKLEPRSLRAFRVQVGTLVPTLSGSLCLVRMCETSGEEEIPESRVLPYLPVPPMAARAYSGTCKEGAFSAPVKPQEPILHNQGLF